MLFRRHIYAALTEDKVFTIHFSDFVGIYLIIFITRISRNSFLRG